MIVAFLVILFNIFLLTFPQIVLTSAREGLLLWFNNVLPTLLPFMIATNILISLGFTEFFAEIAAPVTKKLFGLPGVAGFGLLAGLTSGYPVGAKTVADLKRAGRISTNDAQHLLAFCNNAGPLFILGVVGVGMFGSARVGYVLWAAHIVSALLVGVLYNIKKRKSPPQAADYNALSKISTKSAFSRFREKTRTNPHIGKLLGEAVKNSIDAIVIVGGLIIFFSVVLAVIEAIFQGISLPEGQFSHFLAGLIEITGGARRLSFLAQTPQTLALTAFIIAFGGLSVHSQTFHFTAGTGIKNRPYILAKLLHGVLAAVLTVGFFSVIALI